MSIQVNESTWDRVVRVWVGLVSLVLAFTAFAGGMGAWLAGIVGVVLVLTGAVGFCPMYTFIGFKTKQD
ncbi:MAG: hypothetical protein OHK0052_20060 [Anaerolineales bacterium]